MTTNSTATVIDQTTDAAFRTWIIEVAAMLTAVGMVQTADAGQINTATATRAAVGTAAGFQTWRYADSTYYVKLEYGSGGTTSVPQMWATWGTGTNGSGTITGQTSTRNTFTSNGSPSSTVTAYTSRMCHTADAFSFTWKEIAGSANSHQGVMVHGKSVDGAGAATATGFAVIRELPSGTTQVSKQCVRTAATAVTYNDIATDFVIPGDPNLSSTASSGFSQAYQVPMNIPDVLPFAWACSVLLTELPRGTTMSVAMVGSVLNTYISVGSCQNATYNTYTLGKYCLAMVWQ